MKLQEGFAAGHRLRVRYNEVDLQNIVFNANYLVYADIAVTEYFRALNGGESGFFAEDGGAFGDPDGDTMVRHAEVDFLASAKADDELDLNMRVSRLGKTSFNLQVRMMRGDEHLNDVNLTYVYVLKSTWKKAPLPDHFINLVDSFEQIEPERPSS